VSDDLKCPQELKGLGVPTHQANPEQIARGLSEAQKRALLEAIERGPEYRVPGFELRNERVLDRLWRKGLANPPSFNRGNRLTSLGLAVRRYLQEQSNAK
jgi:hypothetical protein